MATRQAPVTVPCKYKTGKILGHGTYATVKEAMHIETGKYYACKVINKKLMEGREHMIRNEVNILKKISQNHPNILSLVDYFETVHNLYLITELASGGELFNRLCVTGNFFERDAARIVRTVCDAVAYLHKHGIVHRDLKPENILFRTEEKDADLLVADFGLSRIIDNDKLFALTTTCGTPGYMAPEILRKTGHGTPVDLWAIGVITFFLLSGYTPFERSNTADERAAIINAEFNFDENMWESVGDEAKDFIRRCLTIDPTKRMKAGEALEHPWLTAPYTQPTSPVDGAHDLLPAVRQNLSARRKFQKAVDIVRISCALSHKHMSSDTTESSVFDLKPVNEAIDEVLHTDE